MSICAILAVFTRRHTNDSLKRLTEGSIRFVADRARDLDQLHMSILWQWH